MNFTEFVDALSTTLNCNKKSAEVAARAVFAEVVKAMQNGDEVKIPGFGVFATKDRDARTARNPKTGESVDVPAKRVPTFKASKTLKDDIAK